MANEELKKLYYSFGEYSYTTESKERVLSGIRGLDNLINGFEFGEVTIWTGITNSGKTTMLTMITRESIRQGEKVFYFNGEQTKEDFKNNLYKQSSTAKDLVEIYYKETAIKDVYVKQERARQLDKVFANNLFVYDNNAPRDINSLLFAMEDCRRMTGTRIFVIDNFMQIDLISDDIYREQSTIMEKLRTYAVNQKVLIHLVAHPRKTADFQSRLSLYDISGSMNLANKAYNVISLIRVDGIDSESREYKTLEEKLFKVKYNIKGTDAIIEVLKTKGNSCGMVALQYDRQLRQYKESPYFTSEIYEKEKYSEERKQKHGKT